MKDLLAEANWGPPQTARWVTLMNKFVGTPHGWERHGTSIGALMDRWYEAHPIVVEDTSTGVRIKDPLELDTKAMRASGQVRPWTALVRTLDFREHGINRTEFGSESRDVGLAEVLSLLKEGQWLRLESFDPTRLGIEDNASADAIVEVLVEAPRLRHLVFWREVFDPGDLKPGKEMEAAYTKACHDQVGRLRKLGEAPWAANLETLVANEVFIDWAPEPAAAGLRALGVFTGLRRLDVYNAITYRGTVEALLSTRMDHLETLHLGHIGGSDSEAVVSSATAMEQFAATQRLPALKYLYAKFEGVPREHAARDQLTQASFELR